MEAADAIFTEMLRRLILARRSELRALTVTGEDREALTDQASAYRMEAEGLLLSGLDA